MIVAIVLLVAVVQRSQLGFQPADLIVAVREQLTVTVAMTVDTRQPRKSMFYPSEIDQLKALCRSDDEGGAFTPSRCCRFSLLPTVPAVTAQQAFERDLW